MEIFFLKLITFILFCAGGIRIGLGAYESWTKLEQSGVFVRWQVLDSQQKFRQITDASLSEVWVQAENRKYYIYRSENCERAVCGVWLELTSSPEFNSGMRNIIHSGCQATYRYYDEPFSTVEPRYPPQSAANPVECAVTVEHNPYNGAETLTYYVLLDNGTVWMWKHEPNLRREIGLFIAGPLAGLAAGIMIWFQFQKRFL